MVKLIQATKNCDEKDIETDIESHVRKKFRGVKSKDNKCKMCGLNLKNILLLKMHINFEHEEEENDSSASTDVERWDRLKSQLCDKY